MRRSNPMRHVLLVGGLLLLWPMVSPAISGAHTSRENGGTPAISPASQTGEVRAELITEPEAIPVGRPTQISLRFHRENGPLGPARVAFRLELVEDGLPVLEGDLLAEDGALSFAMTFVDGSEHRFYARIRPVEASPVAFSPFEVDLPLSVIPLAPPAAATAGSMGLLLGVVIVGLALGLWGGKRLFAADGRN